MNPHTLDKKRELGAYYTPQRLSQVLVDWAITSPTLSILEPSFGGCGFFESCIARLKELNCENPSRQLYGVDIDPHAFDILSKKFGTYVAIENRFLHNDFIKITRDDFLVSEFDVVIGNPPYVSMHNMTKEQRNSCETILRESPFSLNTIGRNASLWAFFLLHSLSFLREGGKVAWILPSSLLHADYAKKLIEIHRKHFKILKIVKLAERFFKSEGAAETSVILIAEGFSKEPLSDSLLNIATVDNLKELNRTINEKGIRNSIDSFENYRLSLTSINTQATYLELNSSIFSKRLYHYLDIKIGMVTGANKFFVVDKETVEKNNLSKEYIQPVIGKFSSLIGIRHTKTRQAKIQRDNYRSFLITPYSHDMRTKGSPIRKYLSQVSASERKKNQTFKKRPNWYTPDDKAISDGFLSYMIHLGPRMVINHGKINCTNSIHKVFFHSKELATKKLAIAMSLLSSYSQLSAEIEGRAYSSGVLKIEPSAGKRIRILLSESCIGELNSKIVEVEELLKKNKHEEVTLVVDNVLINNGLITREQCDHLAKGVHLLRRERYKGVKNNNEY